MKMRGIFWMFSLVITGLFPGSGLAQRQLLATQEDVQFLIPAGGSVPRFTNGRLAGVIEHRGDPTLYIAGREGNWETVNLDIAGSDYTTVLDMAAGSDGSLAAVGNAISANSRMGTFITVISPDRSRQVITRVWPYAPEAVTVAPDGTVWTVGSMLNNNYVEVYPNVLRHYKPSGELLASMIVSRLQKSHGGLYAVAGGSALVASNDRVGWLTLACQYLEFSPDGVELGRYNCPAGYSDIHQLGGVALSPADDLVVAAKQAAPLAPLELDRVANSWRVMPVLQDSGNTNEILGFDGLTLVTRGNATIRHYALSHQSPAGGQ